MQISGGQQQRVALARSLVLEPSILLLDEPLSNLDYKLRLQMRRELLALQRRLGMTFVFVTHDQSEALALSDKIAVLSQGRIEQVGTPAAIYNRPKSYFVADFIGGSNLLKVSRVKRGPDGRRYAELESGARIAVAGDEATEAGAWIAIRPEHLRPVVTEKDHEIGVGILEGRPVSRIFSGDRAEVTVELDNSGAERATQVTCYVDPALVLGETISLSVIPGGAVLVGGAP
jgi:ABC-type Fe3+/spermidine/putrescine transport system ATPase subunit